jgi:hypothetical protein
MIDIQKEIYDNIRIKVCYSAMANVGYNTYNNAGYNVWDNTYNKVGRNIYRFVKQRAESYEY